MKTSASSATSSSSSSSQYFSAIHSPSTRENTHDLFIGFSEEVTRTIAAASSSSSSPYFSAIPSPTRENTHDVVINFGEEDARMTPSSLASSSSSPSSTSTSQSSSANPSPSTTHDVFISFRGEDTRNGFVSHLRAAFTRSGIRTYMDCDLERGNEISSTLLVAIKQSKILIIVFSEKYADSRWTLDELVKIMECRRIRGQFVIPIFYKVRPTDVRHQRESYKIALKRHKKSYKASKEKVQQWTEAMTEAANLSGWEFPGCRYVRLIKISLSPIDFSIETHPIAIKMMREGVT